ncbi:MAG: tRNA uridine-5-carboxymethylaminomethyl(34) synthesis enzyme MnmG [Eubacteriaceae bacterium]|nr:tRNA uridine-5-carboxymethylaminomethyl(34) synthesis enzyme MnmG [Eubacteriaceae bacterium]
MEIFEAGNYDIVVIGAGHAGVEAALAAARKGKKTLLLTLHLDALAMMPCNPSIGGTGKGHLVREIDALGGEMGKNIDKTYIQNKMLNTAKGAAVHSLRAQADKEKYRVEMKKVIEKTPNLELKQQQAVSLVVEDGTVKGVITQTGAKYDCKAVIICSGTYLKGKIIIGTTSYEGGPGGLLPANYLSEDLKKHGFDIIRLKTGTPARVNKRSIDFSKLSPQYGDAVPTPFSFDNEEVEVRNVPCYLGYTNEKTHEVIRQNLHRSPLYSGMIEGVGPRYCPSFEDKVVRFADKERHQLFVEPEGLDTDEVYIQGMSSSLPEDVQLKFMRTIEGFENVEIMRSAYAIEYDAIDPTQLKLSLETRLVKGLFTAGQINGTSGYEEAAAQGLIAGINASCYIDGTDPLILDRSTSYIGVLIDDIVTKGTKEPYRIMTSRVEYRLYLRQDNADRRLTRLGYEYGLVSKEKYERVLKKEEDINSQIERLKTVKIPPTKEVNEIISSRGTSPISGTMSIYDLLKRPQLDYSCLRDFDPEGGNMDEKLIPLVEIEIKYEEYIKKQYAQIEKFRQMETRLLPEDIDYATVPNLRLEARDKLNRQRPHNLGQAGRISGVSPSDISALVVHLAKSQREDKNED